MMFDYFRGELLARMPDDEVQFLTRISVLERLTGPLCDAVAETTGSADLLERLERSNLFVVPLDRERRWYRIHSVFRRTLQAELQRREPELVSTLRKRAAWWCSRYGDHELAVEYARAAGDVDLLSGLLVASPLPFTATGHPARLQSWLDALDDDKVLERNPILASIGALTWGMTGRADTAERWADAAERGSARARTQRKSGGGPWQALLRSLMSPTSVEEMCIEAERAVATLPLGSAWRAPALLVLGSAQALAGEIKRAESILSEAADTAASVGDQAVESVVLGYQSMLAASRGDHLRADSLADAARRIVLEGHLENHVASLFTFAASAQSGLRRGDWSQVRADLERAEELLPRLTHAVASFAVLLRLEFARVHLALGDSEGGARLLDEIEDIFARRPRFGIFREEALQLRAQLGADAKRYDGRQTTLTAAELRLLPLLTTHLSFREIAERLYVSRNTVKTQAISVYRKLGVTSRGDAIARAGDPRARGPFDRHASELNLLKPKSILPTGAPAFPLLESKLQPPTYRSEAVPRVALVERLQHARRVPAVVIEAPAGYGKTTLATQWLANDRRAVGWYSIDESDNDPVVFMTYLAAALAAGGAEPALKTGSGSTAASLKAMVAEVVRAFSSLSTPAVLVLDNVHLLRNRTALRALNELLAHVPSASQIAVHHTEWARVADLRARGGRTCPADRAGGTAAERRRGRGAPRQRRPSARQPASSTH